MRQIRNFFGRFSEKSPFLYFLVVGIGGGWLLVFIARYLLFLAGGGESLGHFRNVPSGLGTIWIIWHVLKYACGR